MCTMLCILIAVVCVPAHYVVRSDCSVVCLCTTWCTLDALVLPCALVHALRLLRRLQVSYVKHSDCFCVCLRDVSYNVNALVFACVMCHALRLLWCLPVHYLLHSHCYCDGLCNTSCTMIALAFPCVIDALSRARWLLWCWHATWCTLMLSYWQMSHWMCSDCSCACLCYISCCGLCLLLSLPVWYFMHSDCSGVCLCITLCATVTLVCANVNNLYYTPIVMVLACRFLCSMIALLIACSFANIINTLCWLAYTLHTRWLLGCVHV